MNIKKLKEELSKFPDDAEVYVTNDMFKTFSFPIEGVEEGYTMDEDEPAIVLIKS